MQHLVFGQFFKINRCPQEFISCEEKAERMSSSNSIVSNCSKKTQRILFLVQDKVFQIVPSFRPWLGTALDTTSAPPSDRSSVKASERLLPLRWVGCKTFNHGGQTDTKKSGPRRDVSKGSARRRWCQGVSKALVHSKGTRFSHKTQR